MAWIIQWNPNDYPVFDMMRRGEPIENVSVRQGRSEIRPGHPFALWLSKDKVDGHEAGIYAAGTITSEPWEGEVDEEYEGDNPPKWFVDVKVDRYIFHDPITRSELKAASSYSDLRILKVPNMTSYDVTLKHWRALDAEINKRNPQMLP